jgi:hypothetical protein
VHPGGFPRLAGGRKWMAGNGRVMKNRERDPDEEQEELDAIEETDDEAPENSSGLAWLYSLADKVLRRIAPKIMQALETKASTGEANSIKLLMAIAKNKPPEDAPTTPGGKTLAQILTEEPEWQEPAEVAETDNTDVEPAP